MSSHPGAEPRREFLSAAAAFDRPCPHTAPVGGVVGLAAARHGQSTINAGIRPATIADSDDMVIELTELGTRQAAALGRHLAARPPEQRPDLVLCSPYLRTVTTWRIAEEQLRAAGVAPPCRAVDVRLIDRFRGAHTRLSMSEVGERFPQEIAAQQADPLGYRPPGGESFRDVGARLRAVVERIDRDRVHRSVLIVAHDATVLLLRMLLENLSDAEVLAIADNGLAGNASITTWSRDDTGYQLTSYDDRDHLL